MYEKPSLVELQHFGVKGMKWGKRKARPMDPERARMKQLSRSPHASKFDKALLEIGSKSYHRVAAETFVTKAVVIGVKAAMSKEYRNNPAGIADNIGRSIRDSYKHASVTKLLAKTTADRFNDDGTLKSQNKLYNNREAVAFVGINVAKALNEISDKKASSVLDK